VTDAWVTGTHAERAWTNTLEVFFRVVEQEGGKAMRYANEKCCSREGCVFQHPVKHLDGRSQFALSQF